MKIKTLSNPPITEALLEIRFNPNKNVTVEKLNEFASAISDIYPNVEPVENQSFQLMFSANQVAQHEVNIEPSGFRLTNSQKSRVVIAAIDKLVVSFMAPYAPWPDLKGTAKKLFDRYIEFAPQTEIVRLGMRYINKVNIPITEGFTFQRYINTFPPSPKHELLGNAVSKFETILVIPHEDIECASTVRQVLLDSEMDGDTEYLPFVLDIDVYQNKAYELNSSENIWDVFEKMRVKKNAIFFSTLTDEAITPYVEPVSNVLAFKKTHQTSSTPSTSQTTIEVLGKGESTLSVGKKEDGVRHIQALLIKLNEVFSEARLDDWDNEGGEAISDAAYYNATKLLSVLPFDLTPPEILPDNDGYIEFEWASDGKNFSMYVTDTNLILYAGYFGEDNRLSGRFNYERCIPSHVELLAREVFRETIM